jgi:hypothetical protein
MVFQLPLTYTPPKNGCRKAESESASRSLRPRHLAHKIAAQCAAAPVLFFVAELSPRALCWRREYYSDSLSALLVVAVDFHDLAVPAHGE